MTERVYKLTFKTPIHIGSPKVGREKTLSYVPSDTLFGALVVAWATTGAIDDLNTYLKQFNVNSPPPFLLTSAFPYAGAVRFFPRPLHYLPLSDDVSITLKTIENVSWVSESIFNILLNDKRIPVEHTDRHVNFIQDGDIWLTRVERGQILKTLKSSYDNVNVERKNNNISVGLDNREMPLSLWEHVTVPRIGVDRVTMDSIMFHTGRLRFHKGCGLWFAVRSEKFEMIETAMRYLEDAGIGGLRSTGDGAFTYLVYEPPTPLPMPNNDDYFVNLARFAPSSEEFSMLRARDSAYKLVKVVGWCQDDDGISWRRKQIRLVTEGAYLHHAKDVHRIGQLVDITPDNVGAFTHERRVYRYGLAFPVGTQKEVSR